MAGPSLRTKEFSGQTLTADVVRLDTDAVVETGIALTEATNAKCVYTSAAMTSAPPTSGLYAVLVKSGSDLIRTYYACLLTSDTSGTADLYDWPVDALLARGQLTVPASVSDIPTPQEIHDVRWEIDGNERVIYEDDRTTEYSRREIGTTTSDGTVITGVE